MMRLKGFLFPVINDPSELLDPFLSILRRYFYVFVRLSRGLSLLPWYFIIPDLVSEDPGSKLGPLRLQLSVLPSFMQVLFGVQLSPILTAAFALFEWTPHLRWGVAARVSTLWRLNIDEQRRHYGVYLPDLGWHTVVWAEKGTACDGETAGRPDGVGPIWLQC